MNFVSNFPSMKSCSGQNALVQRNRGVNALDDKHVQGAVHAGQRLGAILSVDDQLCDHGIVIGRHDAFLILHGIHADADSTGRVENSDLAGRGGELLGMLGVDAALDGVAAGNDRLR